MIKRFCKLIAFLMALCMLVTYPAIQPVLAEVGQDIQLSKLYLKEVKMFYADNADDARVACESEGYIFCPTNLNEGVPKTKTLLRDEREEPIKDRNGNFTIIDADGVGIFLGYKTTENPKYAITDLTLLDMKYTHYEEIDYQDFLDKHVEDFRNEAAQMMALVREFDQKYKAGSPNAIMAYDLLNLFYVDESKPHDAPDNLLAHYLVNETDITFFEKFIQRGNATILNKIIDLLCLASSDYNEDGTTWVDRTKTSEVLSEYEKGTSELRNLYDSNCQDTAKKLVKDLKSFRETYTEAKRRLDTYGETLGYSELEGATLENAEEKFAEAGSDCLFPEYSEALTIYSILESVYYQKAGEVIVNNADLLSEDAQTGDTQAKDTQADDADVWDDWDDWDDWGDADDWGDDWGDADDWGDDWGDADGWGDDNNGGSNAEEETPAAEKPVATYDRDLTLAEYIMGLAADDTLEDHITTLYPLVSALSPAQRATLSLGGFNTLVKGLLQANDYLGKREGAINEAIGKLKDCGYPDGRLYIWTGLDTSLFDKKVVQTDATKEAAAAGIALETSENDAEAKESSDLNQALIVIDICTLGIGGLVMIVSAFAGFSLWSLGMSYIAQAGTYLIMEMAAMFADYILGALFCALQVLNVLAIVVGVVMLLYSILQWCGVFDTPERIDYSEIPDVVFDARVSGDGAYQVRYDTVTSTNAVKYFNKTEEFGFQDFMKAIPSDSDKHAEMTCYQAAYDRWMTLYYSKAPAAGKPIEIIPGEEPFVTSGTYMAPDGYQPLKLITGSSSVDVNDFTLQYSSEESSPLYVFFPGENNTKSSGKIINDDGTYLTNVRLVHHEKREDAINTLKKANFEPIDINLTPDDGFTFVGYQLGPANVALTDIRVATNGTDTIMYGDASYGKRGGDGTELTPDGLALYATTDPSAGSPIMNLSVQYERKELGSGFEPVCLFSGGNAVDFSQKWRNNYADPDEDDEYTYFTRDLPTGIVHKTVSDFVKQDDPSKGVYLYYQPKEQFLAKDESGNPAQRYISGFSYFLAANNETEDARFGSNYEYIQTFARENGFELIEENGSPYRVMSDEAGEMTMAIMWRDVGGYPADTYNFDQVHTVHSVGGNADSGKKVFGTYVVAGSDGGLTHEAGFYWKGVVGNVCSDLTRENEYMIFRTAMYFGVSYTYNPYRAITGVAGLITPYTETSQQIKYTGMSTAAGGFVASNVSIQGNPIMSAGITAGYFNPQTMFLPLYTNYEARQKSDLDWMTGEETEILSRYLLTSGPREGIPALKEGDIVFRTGENPGQVSGYVPLCDLRKPGDYEHPMNLALDTTNKGSKYLYLFLKKATGENKTDVDEKKDAAGKVTTQAVVSQVNHEYTRKTYVVAVVCGVGKNPEMAINNLYSKAAGIWPTLAANNSDIDARPLFTQFDEIIPVDLSSEHPWYELHTNDTNVSSLKNGVWVRGNELAYYRWEGHGTVKGDKSTDEYEADMKCAYIGVIRSSESKNAAYGLVKYYTKADTASKKLNTGNTECLLAGGPVNSPEGKYFLYYSTNKGTAAYQAPITGLHVSKDIFINGYNTSFTVSESDRVDSALPQFNQLRMRTDEHNYIHLAYDRADLPYYEKLYVGVGNTKEEAFTDMIGTTNAYAAVDVNCNYNSFSGKWIAIGYRRTSVKENAIRDVFLYYGENPPDQIRINGGYMMQTDSDTGAIDFKEYADKNGTGVLYRLVKHNLKSGAETLSLNDGNGGPGLYLYYTTSKFYRDMSVESEVTPITNLVFTYGDISPRFATAQDRAAVFERTYYSAKVFNASAYSDPVWECVLGVSGSPANWKLTGEGAERYSLNKGVVPGMNGNPWKGVDSRVYMYVDRALKNTNYIVRESGKLPEFGYYSPKSTFGIVKQAG